MPTYVITGPDGTEYEITGEGGEAEALAEAQRQHRMRIVEDVRGRGALGKIGQTLDDQLRIAASGMTFGWADKMAAGGDEEALNRERALTEDAKTRLASTYVDTPYEGHGGEAGPAALEGLTSLVGPSAALNVGKKVLGGGKLAQGLLTSGVGAGTGALSAAGHDQDPVTGAAIGGAAGALVPLGAAAIAPALRLGGMALGSGAGAGASAALGVPGGGYIGDKAGDWLGKGAGTLVNKGLDTEAGRNSLAAIAMLPATQGWRISPRDRFAKSMAERQ